jgi:hypothetical protein
MIWDKIFWVWFVLLALLFLVLLTEDITSINLIFGSLLVGLALIKLAGERSRGDRPRISRKLLRKLGK